MRGTFRPRLTAIGIAALFLSVVASDVHPQSTASQDKSALPAFRTYFSPEDYSAYHQIWAITSDESNRIYVGSAEGISIFDNASWQLITTPSNTTVRSLDYGFENKVYVGLQGDIGEITPDSSGVLRYRSLLTGSTPTPDFGNVWETHATADGVYFQSSGYIAYWNGTQISWVSSDTGYHTSFKSQEGIIVREKNVGLIAITKDGESLVPGSEFFSDKRVFVLERTGDSGWLVGTRDNGFFELQNGVVTKFATEIDDVVKDNWIYGSIRLSDDVFGIYTLGAGVLVVDRGGRLLRSISMPTEISDRYVISAHMDEAGSLWLGTMNSGIERYRTNVLSLSVYDESLGIDGYIYDIKATNEIVVVSTGSGLHVLELSTESTTARNLVHFKKYDNVPIAWESEIVDDIIYTVSDAGVFRISETDIQMISNRQSFSIDINTLDQHMIFVGGKGAVEVIGIDPSSGEAGTLIEEQIPGEVDVIAWENSSRTLWANIKNTAIVSLVLDSTYRNVISKTEYPYPPEDSDVSELLKIDNKWHYITRKNIYRYNIITDTFEISPLCEYLCKDDIMSITRGVDDSIWIVYPDSVISGSLRNEQRAWVSHDDLKFKRTSSAASALSSNGIIYISERSRLFRYDPKTPNISSKYTYSVLIKSVRPARSDTTYYGVFTDGTGGIGIWQPEYMVPTVSFDQRDLTITLTSTDYAREGDIQYQYRFAGVSDTTWIDVEGVGFTVSPDREGTYTLQIKAKDNIGRESRLTQYRFHVLPPWYRSWWAYVGYVILISFVGFVSNRYVKLRQAQKQAEEQAKELERERVVVKKLQEANERLKQANKLKDEFLATTSHELRTPLTAILGFASVLKEEIPKDAEYREFLDIIEESGGRLMDTLNSLLDLAKIRAGIMDISIESFNVCELVTDVIDTYTEKAHSKGLYLRHADNSKNIMVMADVYALTKVIHNLLLNAIKFTDEGGVVVSYAEENDFVQVKIADTGRGIEESFIPRLFDEYKQESDGLARSHEGSGLGLAITGRLVYMMNGAISVNSSKGHGSEFIVSLPADSNTLSRISAPIHHNRRLISNDVKQSNA